jgi:hypothetical protein
MKDEVHINASDNHGVIAMKIADWIDYYNKDRYQWSLAKLSPNEFYGYVTTGDYSLQGNPPPLETLRQRASVAGAAPEPPEFIAFGLQSEIETSGKGKEKGDE